MRLSSKLLRDHIAKRDLVCIRREGIDNLSIQGFLLDCSDTLLLLQYVYDFHLDGYMLLRRSDLSDVSCRSTDRFQRELLVREGVFEQIDFSYRAPLQSLEAFLGSRGKEKILIVEDEASDPPEFWIGPVMGINADHVELRHFTGIARVIEPPARIEMERITCCQMDTNYIRFYQRYFDRIGPGR
jgi:hypothetical protein